MAKSENNTSKAIAHKINRLTMLENVENVKLRSTMNRNQVLYKYVDIDTDYKTTNHRTPHQGIAS